MAQKQRKYERKYKVQAVKLAKEIGAGRAAKEPGIPVDTMYGWQKAVREGRLDGRFDPESLTLEELKAMIWRYFISCWNRRRVSSANGGLPLLVKRMRYYQSLNPAA